METLKVRIAVWLPLSQIPGDGLPVQPMRLYKAHIVRLQPSGTT
ncbi:hypothetical protein EAKF1_ch4199 [Escherichia albertii KF1]|nr:hypothetical protein EAKF1_ch4199 [Escherichia albertii KF1]